MATSDNVMCENVVSHKETKSSCQLTQLHSSKHKPTKTAGRPSKAMIAKLLNALN